MATAASKQKYKPLAASFETQGDFDKAVTQQAQQQYNPLISANKAAITAEQGQDRGRKADITGWYKGYSGSLTDAYGRAKNALNNIIAANAGANQSAQGALQAALRTNRDADRAAGATIGGELPTSSVQEGALSTAQGLGQASGNQVSQSLGAILSEAANRPTIAAAGKLGDLRAESGRHLLARQQLAQKRQDIYSLIPSYKEKARETLNQEETNKQNLRFQQNIANKQFNLQSKTQADANALAKGQLTLQQQELLHKVGVDSSQLKLAYAQLAAAKLKDKAAGDDKTSTLKAEAKIKAIQDLTDYLTPTAQEAKQQDEYSQWLVLPKDQQKSDPTKSGWKAYKNAYSRDYYTAIRKIRQHGFTVAEANQMILDNVSPKSPIRAMAKRGLYGQKASPTARNAGKAIGKTVQGLF